MDTSLWYKLHGIALQAVSADASIQARLDAIFAPFAARPSAPDMVLHLELVTQLDPWQPAGQVVSQSRFLTCTLTGPQLSAHFPRWGHLEVDLEANAIAGRLLPEALAHYGAFDDIIIIGLGPLLRRRGLFSLHAFAAVHPRGAALLVGDVGAGKTTTGLSLLEAGWKLAANDSPLLSHTDRGVLVHAYPGLLAAYDDTLARFPSLHRFRGTSPDLGSKRSFAAHEAYDDVWKLEAPARLLLFPQVTPGLQASQAERLPARDALLALLPNSIERWDRDLIARHLAVLQALVQQAPAYRLLLAPDVESIPRVVAGLLE